MLVAHLPPLTESFENETLEFFSISTVAPEFARFEFSWLQRVRQKVYKTCMNWYWPGLARYISLIYRIYILYFRTKISDIFDIFNFYRVLKNIFNVTHCDYVLIFSLCVCWLMTCALNIFSVLDNFCQISPLRSNEVWITKVGLLHLIGLYNARTHTIIW